ncbi:hypothetical protein NMY22_g9209 [Coprinellus aureogranulatus]|nr:hypothetical protein NMY22_g9209 [Coprinellus aureogranulatus]
MALPNIDGQCQADPAGASVNLNLLDAAHQMVVLVDLAIKGTEDDVQVQKGYFRRMGRGTSFTPTTRSSQPGHSNLAPIPPKVDYIGAQRVPQVHGVAQGPLVEAEAIRPVDLHNALLPQLRNAVNDADTIRAELVASAPPPEPDSRIEKGKDVKFSVDDFEKVSTSPWEGVRNYEARNIMKEMKVGDQALFYHSNCKEPGIAAFAEVSKLAYPDYTAWDPTHPYYDAKSDPENPKWYMVDLTFKARAKHFVPLALLKYIASVSLPSSSNDDQVPDLIEELSYLSRKEVAAIKGMPLVSRGRLSVQRVSQAEWDAINLLAEKGGWEGLDLKKLGSSKSSSAKGTPGSKTKTSAAKAKAASTQKKATKVGW